MDIKRAFLAVALSLVILLGYQYFFMPSPQAPDDFQQLDEWDIEPERIPALVVPAPPAAPVHVTPANALRDLRLGRDIVVETSLYSAIISETNGGFKSFKLRNYLESLDYGANMQQLIVRMAHDKLPLFFSWGVEPAKAEQVVFTADRLKVITGRDSEILTMTAMLDSGLEITRTFVFNDHDYQIEMMVEVHNTTSSPLHGAPYLTTTNRPFSEKRVKEYFLFTGPTAFVNGELLEVKTDDLMVANISFTGDVSWMAYQDTYFMTSVIPRHIGENTVFFSLAEEDKVTSVLAGAVDIIPPHSRQQYTYTIYFGPKQLDILKLVGANLDQIVNFGWFDFMAKPALHMLNFLYQYVHNYGVAIILLTIFIKLLFWPIAHKGMKSMKTMQKLHPKMTQLREKHKNNKERLNQEMVKLYQTHKVNPIGGCLPMLLQIPVFFALYKVLLQTIELRHAPFMWWIDDLSAPDRLYIGFDIPLLGGLPVLTLLMGGSMFLQMKMAPVPADPVQAKVMMFLPVIFTFMFINFAAGLVLYWFVNNLMTIAQQYVINRQID